MVLPLSLCVLIILEVCQLCLTPVSTHATRAAESLKQVHVIIRHGDRAPLFTYPNIPKEFVHNWPNGYAELTKGGMRMQQRLGKWFRARYDGILSRHWNGSEIKVLSTDRDRTINSAQANLQGLYSPVDPSMRFDTDLNWSPVPVRILPAGHDNLLEIDIDCPRIKEEEAKLWRTAAVKAFTTKCQPLFRLLTKKLGTKINTFAEAWDAYDFFFVYQYNKLPVPDWVTTHLPFMEQVTRFLFELFAYNKELQLLKGGPLISKIISDMEHKTTSDMEHKTTSDMEHKTTSDLEHKTSSPSSSPNFFLYSAHDDTIAVNLKTLGLYDNILPPPAAAVIYELHWKHHQYYVNLFYRNDTSNVGAPVALSLPGCSTDCPLQQFRQLLQHVLPTNYAEQCRRTDQ